MTDSTLGVKHSSLPHATRQTRHDWAPIDWLANGAALRGLVAAALQAPSNSTQAARLCQHAEGLAERVTARLGLWYQHDGDEYEDRDEVHIWPKLKETERCLALLKDRPTSPWGDCRIALMVLGHAMLALDAAARLGARPTLRAAWHIERACLAALGRELDEVRT